MSHRLHIELACLYCGRGFRPWNASSQYCSRRCGMFARGGQLKRGEYTYRGRLSDALWREIHAARSEAATAPLYRPGASL